MDRQTQKQKGDKPVSQRRKYLDVRDDIHGWPFYISHLFKCHIDLGVFEVLLEHVEVVLEQVVQVSSPEIGILIIKNKSSLRHVVTAWQCIFKAVCYIGLGKPT